VYGYGGSKNAFAFDKALQPELVYDLLGSANNLGLVLLLKNTLKENQ
jgi:hypothetical protein